MKSRTQTRRMQGGFTLLEAALVVAIMGMVLGAMMVGRNQSASKSTASEAVFMDSAITALFKYSKRNNRLPCPDVNGDGLEDRVSGVCTADVHSGGVPYLTLEMPLSSPVGTGLDRQFVYSVFRGSNDAAKDLTLSAERSTPLHVAPNISYANKDDFKQAVINANFATSSTVDASNLYVTGNDSNSGAANCSTNKVANMAFVVAFAGQLNADDAGSDFDGPNLPNGGWNSTTTAKWESVKTNTCFAGPGKPITAKYDDQIRAVSFIELMGFLAR